MKRSRIFLFSATLLAGVSLGITSVHADETNANIQETTVSQPSVNKVSSGETTSTKQNTETSTIVQSAAANSQSVTAATSGETQATSSAAQSTKTATTQAAQAAYYYNSNYSRGWHSTYNYDGTTDWTYAKSDGTMAQDEWLWINGSWYYFEGSKLANHGWCFAPWHGQDHYYYFDANGHYETNRWHSISNYDGTYDWSYSKSDGTRAEDEWLWINGSWYYFEGSKLANHGWCFAPWHGQDHYYYFDANGHYETNRWHSISNYDGTYDWSYSKSDGTRAEDEWLWINGSWYYFDGSKLATNGWHLAPWHGQYNSYYFDENGHY